jgi:hypothetical protein
VQKSYSTNIRTRALVITGNNGIKKMAGSTEYKPRLVEHGTVIFNNVDNAHLFRVCSFSCHTIFFHECGHPFIHFALPLLVANRERTRTVYIDSTPCCHLIVNSMMKSTWADFFVTSQHWDDVVKYSLGTPSPNIKKITQEDFRLYSNFFISDHMN